MKSASVRACATLSACLLVYGCPAVPIYMATRGSDATPWQQIGKVDEADGFRPGALYIAKSLTNPDSDGDKRTWLVVNFDEANAAGEKSYAAAVKVNCASGAIFVTYAKTSASQYGAEPAIKAQLHEPPLALKDGGAALKSAVQAVCP